MHQRQQQQMFGGGMQEPFYSDMQRMGSHPQMPSPSAPVSQQQRSPGLRASPSLGGSLVSNSNSRGDPGVGLGMEQAPGSYSLQSRSWK